MIPFNFEYYKPGTIEDVIITYKQLTKENKSVMYYGGGTEFISRARRSEIKVDAVIDLKGIPECQKIKSSGGKIIIGSTVTLSALQDSNHFPLLSEVCRHIATRTERNKITIGGNLSSHLKYREALLPFLLAQSTIMIAGLDGKREANITDVFKHGNQLKADEFIVSIVTDEKVARYPYVHNRRTKQSNINYPTVSLAAMKAKSTINIACSGLCEFPFRLEKVDLNSSNDDSMKDILKQVPASILDDMHASKKYRTFVFEHALLETFNKLEGLAE